MIRIRPVTVADAATLARLYRDNREFLAPWEPLRDEEFFTAAGQRPRLEVAVDAMRAGTGWVGLIESDGVAVGRIALSAIERGAAQSAHLGYWVARAVNGRGVATEAVRLMIDLAFGELGLHRLQAETLPHNVASRRVLARHGFTRIGLAPAFLHIAGRWQDHVLFQRLAD